MNKGDDIAGALVQAGGIEKFLSFAQNCVTSGQLSWLTPALEAITPACDMDSEQKIILDKGASALFTCLDDIMKRNHPMAAYFAANTVCNLLDQKHLWQSNDWDQTAQIVHDTLSGWNLETMAPLSRIRFDTKQV